MFSQILMMVSCQMHIWVKEFEFGENQAQAKFENQEDWKFLLEDIEEEFLTTIFGNDSRATRDKFEGTVLSKHTYLFKPAEARKLLLKKCNF